MIWRTTLFRNMKWLYLSHLSIGQSKLNLRVDNRNAVPKFQNLCRIFFGWHLAALLQTLRYRKCETVFYNYLYNYLLIQLFIYTIIYTKLVQLMTFWKMSLMSSAFQSLRLRFFRLGQWWLNICFEYREGTFRTVLITYQWNK